MFYQSRTELANYKIFLNSCFQPEITQNVDPLHPEPRANFVANQVLAGFVACSRLYRVATRVQYGKRYCYEYS
jgi:hypothetical protein